MPSTRGPTTSTRSCTRTALPSPCTACSPVETHPADGEPLPVPNMALLWTVGERAQPRRRPRVKRRIRGRGLRRADGVRTTPLPSLGLTRAFHRAHRGRPSTRRRARLRHTFMLSDLTAGMQSLLAATRPLITDVSHTFLAHRRCARSRRTARSSLAISGHPGNCTTGQSATTSPSNSCGREPSASDPLRPCSLQLASAFG